jgi:hypothetical protein
MIVFINLFKYVGKLAYLSFCEFKVKTITQLTCNVVIQQQ